MYEEALAALAAPGLLKKQLPIPYVLEKCGIRVELQGQRLVAVCPWHNDSSPSLYVLPGDEGWRWGCWVCGVHGDVIDLIRKFRPEYGFAKALGAGLNLVEQLEAEDWKAPVLEGKREWDGAWMKMIVREAQRDVAGVDDFLRAKGLPLNAEWLSQVFGVGCFRGEIIIPVYSHSGELVGAKHRRADGSDHPFAFPGSKLNDVLYGERNDGGDLPVILCEGESDTWVARATCPMGMYVLGLSHGAGQAPKLAERFNGRKVHICFDGDEAGRMGANRWAGAIASFGGHPQVWDLPDGADICSVGGVSWVA